MKKAVAFLLAFLIFVAPMTTLVKADVVIGDNDETIINENATILGRKLAMLESLSDLALSGVTEFNISNTEDVDTYLESLWTEVNDAIDYLNSGEWVGDIPDNIASKYYNNLVNYRDVVNNRGEFLGFDLQNPATSLLKTYFANDTYGKKYTSTNLYQSLDMVRALSALTRGTPTPSPDPDYTTLINVANNNQAYGFFWGNMPANSSIGIYPITVYSIPASNFSWCSGNSFNIINYSNNGFWTQSYVYPLSTIYTLYINSVDNNYTGRIDNMTAFNNWYNYNGTYQGECQIRYNSLNNFYQYNHAYTRRTPNTSCVYSGTLYEVMSYFCNRFRNINIYVDGVPWSIVGDVTVSNPTLDIDGILKIYGNDSPSQYQLQPNTQIDYDQLYQVIYNAIRNNLPISQGDINYYDSHDTIYSPTIINNYGEEEGNESDLIDTILDYAIIPKFDTAIAQPMRSALTNGVVIMNNSITNVIPQEILIILGACFFLLLFAVVINRMIK